MVQFGMPQNKDPFETLWEKSCLSANDPIPLKKSLLERLDTGG